MTDILVVIVLYKCRLIDSLSYLSLTESLRLSQKKVDLLIYDNSPEPMSDNVHSDSSCNIIAYISDTQNGGVSKAYNIAYHYAERLDKQYVLLLDQDTNFPVDAIAKYSDALMLDKHFSIYAPFLCFSSGRILSPCHYIFYRSIVSDKYGIGENDFKRETLLNSGLLVSVDLFRKVGGYNEDIKLDYADTDFIERVKKYESQFYLLDVKCIHALSSDEKEKEKVLRRFDFYCDGAREYSKKLSIAGFLLVYFWSFLRTIKLCLSFRDSLFLRKWFSRLFYHV